MKYKKIKDNILKLIEVKNKTKELIDNIYHESGDVCLKIYSDDPISIFVENPRGFELLSEIFKKRIMLSNNKIKGEYSIKRYFCYKDVEFFCLYKKDKEKRIKFNSKKFTHLFNLIKTIFSALKTAGVFILWVLKFIVK